MGTPDFSVPVLEGLVDAGHQITAVYTQPPRPAGRGKKERPTPVHAAALARGLDVRHPASLKSDAAQADFAGLNAELAIVVAYGLILPIPVLDAPRVSQHPRLAFAALAGRGAHSARDHGRRRANGGVHHADGSRS